NARLPLLFLGNVQEHLYHLDPPLGQPCLKPVDRRIPPGPRRTRHKLVDPHDQNVFIMRAIEHAEDPRSWKLSPDPPQEVVREFLRRGRFERCDRAALGIDLADNVTYRATLT